MLSAIKKYIFNTFVLSFLSLISYEESLHKIKIHEKVTIVKFKKKKNTFTKFSYKCYSIPKYMNYKKEIFNFLQKQVFKI